MRGLLPNPSLTGVLAEGPAIFLTRLWPAGPVLHRSCPGSPREDRLVRRPQVHDQDVILGRRDQVIQPRGHLGAAAVRRPQLILFQSPGL